MKLSHLLSGLLTILIAFAIGCPRNDVQITPPDEDRDTATIEGRLEMPAEFLQGTNIVAHEITSDGQLLTRTVGTHQTDAQGHFSVELELPRDPLFNIIVEAHRDNERIGRVIVVETLGAGDTVTTAPINQETTIEADVYVQAVAGGEWDARTTTPFLRYLINAPMAMAIATGTEYEADVEVLTRAVTANMKAFASTVRHERFDMDQEAYNNAMSNLQDAQVNFDDRLHNTTDIEEVQNAYQEYYENWLDAMTDTDMNLQQVAIATQAGAEAQNVYLTELSDTVQGPSFAHLESIRAMVVTQAINERFDELNLDSDQQQAVEQAGQTLRNTIAALAPTAENAALNLQNAWNAYREAVELQLNNSLEEGQRPAFNQTRDRVQTQRGPLFDSMRELSPRAESTAIANASGRAIPNFHADTFSDSNMATLQGADISESESEAILSILFNLSLATGR